MLFSSDELKTEDPVIPENKKEKASTAIHEIPDYRSVIGKVYNSVEEAIGEIEQNVIIEYTSAAEWSMHELLFYILTKTGPAEVYIATWSMSENASRSILQMIESGMITRLSGVIDFRTKNRHPAAFQLAASIFSRMRLYSNHAKVTVIENENWSITITGSANYTNNPRAEAGVILPFKTSAEHNKAWICRLLDKGEPFHD
ncbi:MAG: hypothetical protein EOO13_09805 [Chitinophagaceae bacterium]|nr:MAG: hypothetical protein EOO13_09805 [Chitinophagaceae bacterium]